MFREILPEASMETGEVLSIEIKPANVCGFHLIMPPEMINLITKP